MVLNDIMVHKETYKDKDNFLDTYVLEFLNLPERFSEYTLKVIDKNLLKKKLHELAQIVEVQQLSDEDNDK